MQCCHEEDNYIRHKRKNKKKLYIVEAIKMRGGQGFFKDNSSWHKIGKYETLAGAQQSIEKQGLKYYWKDFDYRIKKDGKVVAE